MIAYVIQETDTFCFPACLESFLAENGILTSQRKIIQFAKHAFLEGAQLGGLAPKNIFLVGEAFELEIKLIKNEPVSTLLRNESYFVHLTPAVEGDNYHWVRLIGANQDNVCLMDPCHEYCPRKMAAADFFRVEGVVFHIRLVNEDGLRAALEAC